MDPSSFLGSGTGVWFGWLSKFSDSVWIHRVCIYIYIVTSHIYDVCVYIYDVVKYVCMYVYIYVVWLLKGVYTNLKQG